MLHENQLEVQEFKLFDRDDLFLAIFPDDMIIIWINKKKRSHIFTYAQMSL